MRAQRVIETCLYVDDLEVAEKFYAEVMGLDVITRGQGRHVFFHIGDAVYLLFNPKTTVNIDSSSNAVPTHGAHGPGHVAFAMQEDEVDAWREHLLKHDVEIEKELTWAHGGFSIYFRDPAGNSLELVTPRTWGIDS